MTATVHEFLSGVSRHLLHVTAEQSCEMCHGGTPDPMAPDGSVVTLAQVYQLLQSLNGKVDKLMSEQSDLNNDVQLITTAFTTLAGDVTALTSYIASLVAGEQPVDLSQLDALAQAAAGNVQAVTSLLPAPAPASSSSGTSTSSAPPAA